MNKRPLVNTRDEPHADAATYRRFHVIIGDSNASEWATALKVGTTALALDLIERGKAPELEIAQPVNATKIDQPRPGSPLDHQEAERRPEDFPDRSPAAVPEGGATGVRRKSGTRMAAPRMKKHLKRPRARRSDDGRPRGLGGEDAHALVVSRGREAIVGDPWLRAIDLEYHNIQPDRGLFFELQRRDRCAAHQRKFSKTRIFSPPETTAPGSPTRNGAIQSRDQLDSMGMRSSSAT